MGLKIRKIRPGVMAVTQGPLWRRRYTYWFQGSYGNFLVGNPEYSNELRDFLKQLGGIFRVIPFHSKLGKAEQSLFNTFGCSFVVPQAMAEKPQLVPCISATDNPIVGVDFQQIATNGSELDWQFEWRDMIIVSKGFAEQRASFIADPKRVHKWTDATVQSSSLRHRQEKASAVLSRLWSSDPKLILVAHDQLQALIAYDDIEFERNDYEVLSPKQRKQLHETLVTVGYQQQSSHIYHGDNSSELHFAKAPKSLASSILDPLSNTKKDETTIVTATQGAMLIAANDQVSIQQRKTELLDLIKTIPINLKKLRAENIKSPWNQENWHDFLKSLERQQADTILHYRSNRVKGLKGRTSYRRSVALDKQEAKLTADENPT